MLLSCLPCTHVRADAEALLASLDPDERAAVLAALSKKRRRAEKAARLEQAQVGVKTGSRQPALLEPSIKLSRVKAETHQCRAMH